MNVPTEGHQSEHNPGQKMLVGRPPPDSGSISFASRTFSFTCQDAAPGELEPVQDWRRQGIQFHFLGDWMNGMNESNPGHTW